MTAPIKPKTHAEAPIAKFEDVRPYKRFPIIPERKYIISHFLLSISSSKILPKKYRPSMLKKRCDAFACRKRLVKTRQISKFRVNAKALNIQSKTLSGIEKTKIKIRTLIIIINFVIPIIRYFDYLY
jgi:hypothetical protein